MCAAGHARRSLRRSLYPACRNEFFLYEKMGRRAIDHAEGISEAGAEIQHPITPKRRESKGTRPLGRRLAGSRPAALTLGQRPRGLPLCRIQLFREAYPYMLQIVTYTPFRCVNELLIYLYRESPFFVHFFQRDVSRRRPLPAKSVQIELSGNGVFWRRC